MNAYMQQLWRRVSRHKWKIFMVSTCLKILVIFTVAVYTHNQGMSREKRSLKDGPIQETITFDDYFSGKFYSKSFYPRWIGDAEYAYKTPAGAIKIKNLDADTDDEILDASVWMNTENPASWSLSPDKKFAIITWNYIDGYAHYVRTFNWTIYETATGLEKSLGDIPSGEIQKFKWSNNGHDLAYVLGFNLFVSKDFGLPEQLTTDGLEGHVFNGITDWLYVQEITDDDALFWWSPNDDLLAFAAIHQKDVRQFEFSVYDKQYPTMVKLPYPKPGTPIPQVHMYMARMTEDPVTMDEISNCVSEFEDEFYLNQAVWRSDIVFTATYKNRYENKLANRHYTLPDFTCQLSSDIDDVSSATGWLGHYKPHDLIPMNADEYILVNSYGGFPHIQVINKELNTADWRTSGDFEVTDTGSGYHSIFHYDSDGDWIYYTSTELETKPGTGLPRIRHMWRVSGHSDDRTRTCITCELNERYADQCNWVTPSFSRGEGTYVVINCGGTANGVPVSLMMKRDEKGFYEVHEVIEDNAALLQTLEDYSVRQTTFGSMELPGVEGDFYYILHKPADFDENKKYPLLVEVYSGPGYQKAEDRYVFSWKDYVASSLDIIVMSFDGRGTGFRGDHIMHQVYKKLGQYEPLDQIAAAKKLIETNDFIDADHTAIWGWSYGGYTTTRTVEVDADNVFKCGFAVAPVTDWTFYHSIYTERYMLKPEDNPDGYLKSTALQQSANVAKHRYVVLHGTRDENVHFQNAAQLEKYLVADDVDFGAYFFADNDHGMGNTPNNYRSVYKTIEREMAFCFERESAHGDCCK